MHNLCIPILNSLGSNYSARYASFTPAFSNAEALHTFITHKQSAACIG